jgi:hypothetical protein
MSEQSDDATMRASAAEPRVQDAEPAPETALVLRIPETAKLPEGATFHEGEDDGYCRLIAPDGTRCRAHRAKATGLCPGHSGLGIASQPHNASQQAHAARRRNASLRATLGITARTAAQPLALSRMRAQERAEAAAHALVDGPLDDPELGTIARQQAVLRMLELLYPQATVQASVELPADPEGVASMGWQELQALAAQLGSPE